MTQKEMKKILEIGISLSAESDFNRLWEEILHRAMELTNCDAATLYLLEGEFLFFKILRNNTLNVYAGGDGKNPDLPPVKLNRDSVCALAVLEGKTICIDDVRHCKEYDLSGPIRYDAMTGYHTRFMLVVPMGSRDGEKLGVLQLINAQDEKGQVCGFSSGIIMAVESVASQAAVTVQNMCYTEELRELFWSVVRVMSCAVDERTPYNGSHTRHMAEYGERFIDFLNRKWREEGRGRRFTAMQKGELMASIWLHDLGKLVTPLEVMNKMTRLLPKQYTEVRHRLEIIRMLAMMEELKGNITREQRDGRIHQTKEAMEVIDAANSAGFLTDALLERVEELRKRTYEDEEGNRNSWLTEEEYRALSIRRGTLSEEERRIMEQHVVMTDRLLSRLHFTRNQSHVREWAAGHHELLDGSGYPRGLKGDEIAPEIRMITILDIFDALVADDRPYKPGMPVEKALSILTVMAEKEGKLDSELVRLFIESRCWERAERAGDAVSGCKSDGGEEGL